MGMENSNNVIGRPTEYPKVVAGLRRYLADARADPSLPLSILAACRATGVKKSTLYLHQDKPEVAEILHEIRILAKARKLAAQPVDTINDTDMDDVDPIRPEQTAAFADVGSQPTAVELEVLAIRSAGAIRRAVWSMSRFVGRHRKHRYVSDLPRVVYDIDMTLAELHRIREELRGLSDEWREGSHGDPETVIAGNQLSLSGIYEEQP
jgi:hypothetical protein